MVIATHHRECRDFAIAILQDALAKRAVGRFLEHFRSIGSILEPYLALLGLLGGDGVTNYE